MKSLKLAFLFFVLLFNLTLLAQTDSVQYYYSLAKDKKANNAKRLESVSKAISFLSNDSSHTLYLKTLNTKSFLLYKNKNFEAALIYAKLLLEKSRNFNDTKMQKLALEKLADYNRLTNNLVASYGFYEQLKELALKENDTMSSIRTLQYLSSIQNVLGVPFESEASALKCLKLLESLKETQKITRKKIGIYNQLGKIYKDLKFYNRALELYNKALDISTKISDKNTILNNIANVYRYQGHLIKAETVLKKVYESTLENTNTKQHYLALDNLGFVQSKLNIIDGYYNLQKALKKKEQDSNFSAVYTSHMHLAEYFQDRNNIDKVTFHANKAYNLASNLKSATYKRDALAFLLTTSNATIGTEYKHLMDSIYDAKMQVKNKYASVKYDYSKQLLISKEIELEKEKERGLKVVYQSIGLFILVASLFLFFLLRLKHKKNRLQQAFKTEAKISKKIHDEVANDVYHLMTKIQNNAVENTVLLDDLELIYNKTRDISKENSAVITEGDFTNLLTDLLLSYKSKHLTVITKGLTKMDWKSFSELKKTCIYRVLQELMVNMKKHSQATFVVVTFEMFRNKLIINYSDNGVGAKIKKGNGLQNAENRILDINGSITFESDTNKSFKATIKV